jgi:flagellar biosynthetic protein FliP
MRGDVRALAANPSVRGVAQFLRHYVAMVVAMMAGMMLVGGPLRGILAGAGYWAVLDRGSDLSLLLMYASMTLPMVAWMRHRGHSWRQATEMTAAMVVPAALLVGLDRRLWGPSHLAMLLGMLALMLCRRQEYVHGPAHASGHGSH